MFQTHEDINILKNYLKNGFIVFDVKDRKKLDDLRSDVINFFRK